MENQILNGILCIASFLMYFACLVIDFNDKKNGSLMRRALYIIFLIYNCSLLIRIGKGAIRDILFIWFLVSLIMLLRRVFTAKGSHRRIDAKIKHTITAMKQSGKREAAHH